MSFFRAFVAAASGCALALSPVFAATSALDSAFVTEISPGLTPTSYPTFNDGTGAVNAVALQSDGKILAGGNVSRYKTSGDLTALKRLLATGALDTSFNSGGAGLAASSGQPEVNAILRVAGDKLYVGGVFSSYNGVARSGVLRLHADGSLDTAFDLVGLAGDTRYVMALAEQPDGKLLVGGGFTNINGTFRRHLARLNADGSLDSAFNANVALATATFVGDIALLPNGQLVVAGGRARAGGGGVPLLVRLNADGSLDSSLAPSFSNDFGDIDELLVLPDGRILIGGDFSFSSSEAFVTIPGGFSYIVEGLNFACLLPNGSLDASFMANVGTGPAGWAGGEIALQPDGTILVGGIFSSWNHVPRASIARLNQDGTLETSFAPAPYATHGEGYLTHFYSFAVQPDGKVVAGGWLDHVTDLAVETYNLTRFVNEFSASSAGTLRLLSATATTAENAGSITLQVSRFGGTTGAVSVQFATSAGGANGTATAGSDFTAASGTLSWAAGEGGFKTITVNLPQDTAAESAETFTVTLSNATGGATLPAANAKTVVTIRDDDSAPTVTKHPASASLEQGAGFTLTVGYESVRPTTIQWQRDPDGAGPLGYADVPGATFTTYTVANALPDTHGGLYRAVLTSGAGSSNSNAATVFVSVPSGSVDTTSFTSNLATSITKALPLGDGRYIAITGTGLVRLNANGSVDTTFATVSFSNATSDVLLQSDGKIVVGGFFTSLTAAGSSTSRTGVARFNSDGTVDSGFNLNLTHSVQSLALGVGGKLYVGGVSGSGLKRFTSAGALDTSFSGDGLADGIGTGIPNGYVWAVQELGDGRVLVSHQVGSTFSSTYRLQILGSAGAVDTSFNAPAMNWNVYGWDFLPDGRIAVAGRFTQLDGQTINGLAVLHANGALDTTFVTSASAGMTGVRYHQGRLFAWGNFSVLFGPSNLARFNLDGAVDSSFSIGTSGGLDDPFGDASSTIAGTNGPVTSFAINAAGDFDVFGSFTKIKNTTCAYAARLVGNAHIGAIGFMAPRINAIESGLPLTLTLRRYGPSTEAVSIDYSTPGFAFGVTATPGGDYTNTSGTVSWAAGDSADKSVTIQLLDDAALESAEYLRVELGNPSGPVTAAASATVTLLDDDTPVTFTAQPAGPASALFSGGSLNISGAVATSPSPIGYQWFLNGVAIPGATSPTFAKNPVSLADAGLYTLVATNAVGAFPANIVHVVIAPQPGRIAPGQATTGRPAFQSGGVQTLLALPDGGALVGGFFGQNTAFNVPQGNLVRVKADGSIDTSFALNLGNNVRELLAQPDGKILIAGDFTFVNGVNQRFLYRLNADLTPDTAFNSAVATAIAAFSWGNPSGLALDSTGRIYLGFNNGTTGSVWRFSSAGVLDADYTLSTSTVSFAGAGVTALAMQSDDKLLVGGNFTHINRFGQTAVAKNRLARVNADGSIDTGFTAGLPGTFPINDILLTPGGRLFVAGGTGSGANLVELSATDGSAQTGGSSGHQIYEIASGPDGRLALARAAVNGSGSISRLNIPVGATTSNDTTFNVGTGPNSDVFTLAYASDGSLWIAGTFSTFDGFASGGVLKLQGSAGDPGIVNQPARADINAGGTAYFAVGATGTNLTYQWFKNGSPLANDTRITGATTAVLTITGLVASDDDTYTVEVTGGTPSTTVTSAPAKLNVLGAPTVAVGPGSVTPALGSTITLAADVLAAKPAAYVWKRDGVMIVNGGRYSGATTGALVITGANSSDNGAYTLTVTNNLGAVSTTPATVAVAQNFTDRDDATTALGGPSSLVNDILHLPDGRTLLGVNGTFNGANSTSVSSYLVVVAPNGAVSAPAAGNFNGQVQKLLRQPDGKILVAGSFSQIGGVTRNFIARLNADLTLDTAFVPPAHTNSGTYNQLALDTRGRVYLGGSFSSYAGHTGLNYLVRFDGATGAIDTGFAVASLRVNNVVSALIPDASGRLYIGGGFSSFDSATSTTLVHPLLRLFADGSIDTGYTPGLSTSGLYSYDIRALAFDSSGRLYIAAQVFGPSGISNSLVRLLADGAADSSFTYAGATVNQLPSAILPLPSGKILLGGSFTTPAPGRLLRLNEDGSLDTSFNIGAGLNSGGVLALASDASGRVWAGGSGFSQYQGATANRLVVLQGEASELAIARQPGGQARDLGASASFTVAATANNGFTYQWRKNGSPLSDGGRISGATTDTLTISGLVASDAAGYSVVVSTPSASVTSGDASLLVLAAPFVVRDPTGMTVDLGGSASFSGAGNGASPLGYQWLFGSTPLVNGTVGGVTIAGATTSTLTITGATFAEAGEYRLRVTNAHGAATSAPAVLTVEKRPGALNLDVSQPSFTGGDVYAVRILPDDSYLVGGAFTQVTVKGVTTTRSFFVRILANGTVDTSVPAVTGGAVRAIAVDSANRVFLGGEFTGVGAALNRIRVARLTSALALDTAFDTSLAGPLGAVRALAPTNDGGVFIGGDFTGVGTASAASNRVALLSANGALNSSFTSAANSNVHALLRRSDGNLYIGGDFTSWGGSGNAAGELILVTPAGTRVTGTGAFAYPSSANPRALLALSDGGLLVGGNTSPQFQIHNSNTGAVTFSSFIGNAVFSLAQQPADAKILLGGNFTNRLLRTTSAGATDAEFTVGTGFNGAVNAIGLDSSGRIYVGGAFTTLNGASINRFAVLNGGEKDERNGLLLPQTLTFPAIANRTFGDNGNTLTLAAASDRGLSPITFSVTSSTPANIATVSGSTLTITGAGTITVQAAQAGDATYAAATATQTFVVNKANQTITFPPVGNKTIASPAFELSATATSGLPVSFGVTGVANLGADGKTVTLTGETGTVTITATQPGDANYNAASPGLVQVIEVTAGTTQTIDFKPLASRVAGAKFTLSATATPSKLPVSFAVIEGDATLGADGKTVTVGSTAGTVTIRATQDGGTVGAVTYAPAAPVDQSFVVTLAPPTKTQTITFNAPAKTTYGAAPLTLAATSSAGLPVAFSVVSGPATLEGGSLAFTGAGKVVVRATQPGDATFKPAAAVNKTITVAKAVLAVNFADVSRLVRDPNPPLTIASYSGFVGSDTVAAITTAPTGSTKAAANSAEGVYPITPKGGLAANYTFTAGSGSVTVEGFSGAYEALLVDDSGTARGKLELLVPNNALTYSGTLNLASLPAAIPVRGNLTASDGSAAQASWSPAAATGITGLSLGFELTGDTLDGELSLTGASPSSLSIASGSRVFVQRVVSGKKQNAPWTGLHTLVLRDPDPLDPAPDSSLLAPGSLPLGAGHASVSVAATGVMTFKGKLADGTALTGTARPAFLAPDSENSDGLFRVFLRPYAKRLDSFLSGELELVPHPDQARFPNRFHVPETDGTLAWSKASLPASTKPSSQDKSYRLGFAAKVSAALDPWLPPIAATASAPAFTLPERLDLLPRGSGTDAPFGLDFLGGFLTESELFSLPAALSLRAKGSITLPSPNPRSFQLTVNSTTGALSGSFSLSDQVSPPPAKPVTRKVSVSGTFRQGPDGADDSLGHAHYLLDPVPGDSGPSANELVSGELILIPEGF